MLGLKAGPARRSGLDVASDHAKTRSRGKRGPSCRSKEMKAVFMERLPWPIVGRGAEGIRVGECPMSSHRWPPT